MKIKNLRAHKIKDSRKEPTVEVELKTEKGNFIASCPLGKSKGKNEAAVVDVSRAIENVNKIIAPKLKNQDPKNQQDLDKLMIKLDGTQNKSKLGANAILPVSMVICRAGAAAEKLSLYEYIAKISELKIKDKGFKIPLSMFNFLEGGAHSAGRNNLDLQEFMVVPQRKSFAENFTLANKIFGNLQKIIKESYSQNIQMGDEGGFAPPISQTDQALFLLKNSISGEDAKIAIDAAASQFYKNGKYILEGKEMSRQELIDFYKDLVERFPIISIEDPFAEEDFESFKEIMGQIPNITIIGDDLTTTNIKRIKQAEAKNSCNGVIIKPNQIGTITETIEAVKLSKSYGWKTIVSHRSGETMDDFISDLAVGVGADFIKSGSPTQSERMVKYNRLLEIEQELK